MGAAFFGLGGFGDTGFQFLYHNGGNSYIGGQVLEQSGSNLTLILEEVNHRIGVEQIHSERFPEYVLTQ